uniref:Uncharacterized protein n=1 Tax=Chaetoceros debilis TaxID=122233 RepID=A0A7S3QIQ0_9STRA|mmetsp:Transcript_26911/g.39842  ORF Transcript_26911/g.39842 Transcript_26911/m.39842 type:complete len:262 (+) Transcript_26911:90-875(+)
MKADNEETQRLLEDSDEAAACTEKGRMRDQDDHIDVIDRSTEDRRQKSKKRKAHSIKSESRDGYTMCNKIRYDGNRHKVPRPLRWKRQITTRQACHSRLATWYMYADRAINAISVVSSALSSTAIFASMKMHFHEAAETLHDLEDTLEDIQSTSMIFSTGLCGGLLSTILQSVQTSLQMAEHADEHALAQKRLAKLRFRLDVIFGNNYIEDDSIDQKKLVEWIRDYEEYIQTAPPISHFQFERQRNAEKDIERRRKRAKIE